MDETILRQDIALLRKIADEAACQLLYSPKACSLAPVLEIISESVDGFGCSSPFELELIRRKSRPGQSIHLVSPLLEAETLRPMGGRLDYVTLNSMTQWARLRGKISPKTQTGIRVNPQLSFLNDQRYDPCRPHSKLGVPIHQLAELAGDPTLAGISGLHFHTNCDATDFASLLATVRHIQDHLGKFLEGISWVNMGGGYMFNEAADYGDFFQAVEIFREKHGLQVFIEPGAAMVRRAGSIEASVHDLFDSDEAQVAILMGSQSDWPTLSHAAATLDTLGIKHEARIASAHRTPDRVTDYARTAKDHGIKVIIAGAGGAAALPGVIAALTPLPVFGVPIESQALKGMDSLLSMVQMPGGIPVGTLAIGKAGAINAALLAGAVLALNDDAIAQSLDDYRTRQAERVPEIPVD